ncbi:hypothetical protein FKW77_008680 [Venturia effusa]|uniref:Uncharacterized protein n=1 Tax=Venturia effusa TaxID=50376 RepID=A0A517L7W4_9PEZI|nr:hypothetical protein FKW77_008680 [Venturia effusa]
MVGFLHVQKYGPGYAVQWSPNESIQMKPLPEHIWLDQGHTSNGVAGYGFFLGLLGMFVAFRYKKGKSKSTLLLVLTILLTLATLFTLSALIFTFVVTSQTKNKRIDPSILRAGQPYPEHRWTPETWYKAVMKIPIEESLKRTFRTKVRNMEAWRWMLVPIFLTDVVGLGLAGLALLGARKEKREVVAVEKTESYADVK